MIKTTETIVNKWLKCSYAKYITIAQIFYLKAEIISDL